MSIFSFQGLTAQQIAGRLLFYFLVLSVLAVGVVCAVNAAKWLNKPFPGFLVNQRLKVGYMGQYHWTGTQAGLKSPDKIISADGRTISSSADLDEVARSVTEGQPVTYVVSRNGKEISIMVPTMRFSAMDFAMIAGVVFFLGILYLIIGIVVYFLKPDTMVSWIFFSGCLLLGTSCLMSFDMEATHLGFARTYILIDTVLPAFILHLSMIFPEQLRLVQRHPSVQAVPYVLSAVMAAPIQLTYPGPLFSSIYQFVLLYLIIGALAMVGSAFYAYFRYSSTIARQRARVILFGAAIALPVPALAPFISFLGGTLGGIQVATNFSALPAMIFPASIAYAIAKHNLFDVDVYIKRAVGYGFMTLVVGSGYFLVQTTLDTFVLRPLFGEAAMKVYPVLFAFLVVFLFDPVNRRVQGAVDKLFYRKKADYKETILSVSNDLSTVLDLTEVVKRIIHTVRKDMFIDTAGIFLPEPKKNVCRSLFLSEEQAASEGSLSENLISCDDPLLTVVKKEKTLITKYDIAEDDRYVTVREACGRRFAALGASMVIPLMYQGEVTGAMAVGHKKSGHFYTREDIDLLNTLASHGAVAIENARMAERMKEEEVVRTNLSRYLSPQVVDQIIHKDMKVNLGGDKKVVTVLFSDIRNFTTITESLKPDQMVQILNEYFTEMARIIFEHQGSLDKYIGDAIVAVFGSLIPLENPAANAVRAAIEMMKRLPAMNMLWENEFNVTINIGIGVNTGEVFLGNLGSPERMEFTVIGDTVNVASRFSGLAKSGQVLVTRETIDRLDTAAIQYNELPPTPVKGKTGKLEVFEILY